MSVYNTGPIGSKHKSIARPFLLGEVGTLKPSIHHKLYYLYRVQYIKFLWFQYKLNT